MQKKIFWLTFILLGLLGRFYPSILVGLLFSPFFFLFQPLQADDTSAAYFADQVSILRLRKSPCPSLLFCRSTLLLTSTSRTRARTSKRIMFSIYVPRIGLPSAASGEPCPRAPPRQLSRRSAPSVSHADRIAQSLAHNRRRHAQYFAHSRTTLRFLVANHHDISFLLGFSCAVTAAIASSSELENSRGRRCSRRSCP